MPEPETRPVTGTVAIGKRLAELREKLPFDPLEFLEFEMPESMRLTNRVDAVD